MVHNEEEKKFDLEEYGNPPKYFHNMVTDIVEVDVDPHVIIRKLIRHFKDPAPILGKIREKSEAEESLRKQVAALHKQFEALSDEGRQMFRDLGVY